MNKGALITTLSVAKYHQKIVDNHLGRNSKAKHKPQRIIDLFMKGHHLNADNELKNVLIG